jgi:hypothetical protein
LASVELLSLIVANLFMSFAARDGDGVVAVGIILPISSRTSNRPFGGSIGTGYICLPISSLTMKRLLLRLSVGELGADAVTIGVNMLRDVDGLLGTVCFGTVDENVDSFIEAILIEADRIAGFIIEGPTCSVVNVLTRGFVVEALGIFPSVRGNVDGESSKSEELGACSRAERNEDAGLTGIS